MLSLYRLRKQWRNAERLHLSRRNLPRRLFSLWSLCLRTSRLAQLKAQRLGMCHLRSKQHRSAARPRRRTNQPHRRQPERRSSARVYPQPYSLHRGRIRAIVSRLVRPSTTGNTKGNCRSNRRDQRLLWRKPRRPSQERLRNNRRDRPCVRHTHRRRPRHHQLLRHLRYVVAYASATTRRSGRRSAGGAY